MKVFNLSPQRCGTQSFHSFACAHQHRSEHWCGPDAEAAAQAALALDEKGTLSDRLWRAFAPYYARADFFADFPTPLIYRAAMRDVIDARFVFMQRDAHDWVRSVRRHIGGNPLTFCEGIFYEQITGERRSSIDDYEDVELVAGYVRYCATIASDFGARPGRLLWLQLADEEAGERIAAFCDFDLVYPFPAHR